MLAATDETVTRTYAEITAGFMAFGRDRLVLGPTLVVPLMMVWRDYKEFASTWGFPLGSPKQFHAWVLFQDDVEIKTRGQGRRRRFVTGMGILPTCM